MMNRSSAEDLLAEIGRLPPEWNGHGSLSTKVLRAIVASLPPGPLVHSVETGTGKSTLLLSHISDDHLVFTLDDEDRGSLRVVTESPLLRADSVRFVLGPTQATMSSYTLPPLDFALIDGPHAYPFPELEYYAIYPRLRCGGLLVIDDIHIPTVSKMYAVVREDPMFNIVEVVATTAILVRTSAPTFDPLGDDWRSQPYNDRKYPDLRHVGGFSLTDKARSLLSERVKRPLLRWIAKR